MSIPRPVLVALFFVMAARPAAAQLGPTLAGGALGASGGALVTVAIVTAASRAGRYLYSPDDVRWQLLPIPVGAVAGGVLGYRNEDRMWRAAGYGALGLGTGTLVGALVGQLAWGDAEGVWSGAVIGASIGLVAGSVIGGASWNAEPPAIPLLGLAIPVGP